MKKKSAGNPYWNNTVQNISPYIPGEQNLEDNAIKLNTNENPFAVPVSVIQAIQNSINEQIRLYPSHDHKLVRQKAAKHWQVQPEEIFLGNGSDEVLNLIFKAFLETKDTVVTTDPTYSLYPVLASMHMAKIKHIPTMDNFEIDPNALIGDQKMTIIANPNAPTGIALQPEALAGLARKLPGLLIIDEAYIDFGAQSCIPLIQQNDNILITRTFSKSFSLAGMRIGFAIGSNGLIEALYRLKDSYNMNTVSQIAASAVFDNYKDFQTNLRMIMDNRDYLMEGLKKREFSVLPSLANFVFAGHKTQSGQSLYEYLKNENIWVRHFSEPKTKDWIRITIGTMQQMKALLEALDRFPPASP